MSNIIKLCEVMETKYIINALTARFRTVLSNAVNDGTTIDFADCKLGPDCVHILKEYYGKVKFINSTNVGLNELLQYNYEAVTETPEEYEVLRLENTLTLPEVLDLIDKLPKNAKYKVEMGLSDIVARAACVLLLMARPDIDFDIRKHASDIFEFVRDKWLINNEHHDSYYELIAPNVIRRDIKNDRFGSDDTGWYRENVFVRQRVVLPCEFGNSQIIKSGEKPSDEWKPTIEKCVYIFESNLKKKRKPGKIIKNFLTIREET